MEPPETKYFGPNAIPEIAEFLTGERPSFEVDGLAVHIRGVPGTWGLFAVAG